jgi:hypothetical protein
VPVPSHKRFGMIYEIQDNLLEPGPSQGAGLFAGTGATGQDYTTEYHPIP